MGFLSERGDGNKIFNLFSKKHGISIIFYNTFIQRLFRNNRDKFSEQHSLGNAPLYKYINHCMIYMNYEVELHTKINSVFWRFVENL